MEQTPETWVRVARIGKPHGIRGEVTVEVLTDSPDTRFIPGNTLLIRAVPGRVTMFNEVTVENSRWNKKILLLKFIECSDRNTAESLRNSELYAPAADTAAEDEGWYAEELIGFSVYRKDFESEVGRVSNLLTGDMQDLLEIQLPDGREVLIPFVEEIVPEIIEEQRSIIINPPPGLLELN